MTTTRHSTSPPPADLDAPLATNRVLAYLLLRVTVGVIFLFYGIGKFVMGLGAFHGFMLSRFEDTWLPPVLVGLFAYILPFAEVLLGLLLLLGLLSRWALALTALLMIALSFGTVVESNPPAVANNLLYALVLFILLLYEPYNRYAADHYLRRR
jgi:thiosulfate dehydrogenase (quinone) large subunit